jgi:hypothetical protein
MIRGSGTFVLLVAAYDKLSPDGSRWVYCRPAFFLPVRVLSRLFRWLFLAGLADVHAAGRLAFFGQFEDLHGREAFIARLASLKEEEFVRLRQAALHRTEVVLTYLARYTHRIAIAKSRLVSLDERGVRFRYKNYRHDGRHGFAR